MYRPLYVLGVLLVVSLGVASYFIFSPEEVEPEESFVQSTNVQNDEVPLPGDSSDDTEFTERYSARIDRVDVVFEQKDYTQYRLTTNNLVREGELNTERGFGDDIDATVYVLNWKEPEGEQIYYVRFTAEPSRLYLLDSNREVVMGSVLILEE